ncbi:MAG: RluA family pseudouridine synthase [Acidaminococcaceae bacterium]
MDDNQDGRLQDEPITTEPITEAQAGERVDSFLAETLQLSRANIQKLLEQGQITRQGQAVKSNYRLKAGDSFTVVYPQAVALAVTAENIPLDIIFEDQDVVVLNKACGMVVHPAAGNYSGTLVNALLYHCDNLSGINGVIRPGIVHRLDKDTSGIMIVAKNDMAHLSLSAQIQTKTAKRDYIAIVRGNIKDDNGRIETLIGRDQKDRKKMAVVYQNGRKAITEYEVLERYGKYTVLLCKLLTGRTHQIRVHLEHIGHPIIGDPKYSPQKTPFALAGQALHSYKLTFQHPRTAEILTFTAPLPAALQKIITRLKNGQF